MPRNFWMLICNLENFRITQEHGFTTQGLKAQYRRKVQRVESGDRLLYYVTGIRCFTATATVTASYTEEETSIWKAEGSTGWPYRVGVKPEIVLDESQFIDANLLAHRLEYVRRWPPENWFMAFQGNLHLLPKNDFQLIEDEMKKLKFGREHILKEPPPQAKPQRKHRSGRRNGAGVAAE